MENKKNHWDRKKLPIPSTDSKQAIGLKDKQNS